MVAGLGFGYLFLRHGVGAAMLAHFVNDYIDSLYFEGIGGEATLLLTELLVLGLAVAGAGFFAWYALHATKRFQELVRSFRPPVLAPPAPPVRPAWRGHPPRRPRPPGPSPRSGTRPASRATTPRRTCRLRTAIRPCDSSARTARGSRPAMTPAASPARAAAGPPRAWPSAPACSRRQSRSQRPGRPIRSRRGCRRAAMPRQSSRPRRTRLVCSGPPRSDPRGGRRGAGGAPCPGSSGPESAPAAGRATPSSRPRDPRAPPAARRGRDCESRRRASPRSRSVGGAPRPGRGASDPIRRSAYNVLRTTSRARRTLFIRWRAMGRRMREELLAFVSRRGTLLEPDAIDFLLGQQDPIAPLQAFLEKCSEMPFVVTLHDVVEAGTIVRPAAARARPLPVEAVVTAQVTVPASFRREGEPAGGRDADVRILRDITGRSTCEGTIEDFTRYFRHRFHVLRNLLLARRELAGAQDIAKARKSTREVRIIGLVADVRTTKNGHRILELEDESETVPVLVPSDSQLAAESVVMDEVVGVVGTANDRGLVIAQSLVRPDIPTARPFHGTREHVRAAFMSDIHVGSRTFLEDKWSKVSAWLGGDDEVARSIRYLIVSGDVVDGIGVYPRQDEELAIDDIYAQYEALARMVADLPDRVSVIMLPGNHDAVRPAEPQPAFPASIQNLFDSNVIFAGNPSLLALEGVRILAYHGRSMDDLVSAIPGLSYHRPIDAMKAMLRMRHLAPIYGGKTPIAPEAEDHLIIRDVPDIFATGHVHSVGVDAYRGVVLVNSSTWQAQTPYQKMRNIDPMPARLPIVDLATGQAIIREF